jgi:hypothetical protein
MMPDVIEKSTDAAKRVGETAADVTRRGAELATNVGEKIVSAVKGTAGMAADATQRGAETAAETARRATDQGREAAGSGLRALTSAQGPLVDEGFEQSRRALETTARVTDVYRQAAERAADDVRALFDSWMSFGRGLQQWQQTYADALRQSLESVAAKRQALLQSDSPVRFAEVQRDLYIDLVNNTVQASTRLFELTGHIVEESARPLRERAHARA